jgi:hypothetical protein
MFSVSVARALVVTTFDKREMYQHAASLPH